MSKIRVGLVGYGAWTRKAHVPALARDGRAEIRSVAAPSDRSRAAAAQELGGSVAVFRGIEDLLAGPAVDAVLIAVPDALHEAALSAALDAGVPVLYEPPVADTRARVRPMLRRLLAAGHVTFADLELGLIPAVARAAEVVRAGTLGRVQAVAIRLQSGWGPVADYDLTNFHHMSTWYVDVLNRILGAAPRRVLLLDGRGTPGRRQSQGVGHLDYGGAWGTVQANIASVGELEIGVEVNGDDGDLVIDLLTGDLRLRSRTSPAFSLERWPALSPYADWPGVHESVRAFLDGVASGRAAVNDAATVARLHLVGLAAEESKDTGTWAEVRDLENGTEG